MVNNDSYFGQPVYAFTQQEKNVFGAPQELFYTNSMQVAGEEGVLLGAINDTAR
ncbi:MAG: hypothetical protein H6765_02315 [Candidatus Peribacteria bacterium]|nr:MAG: hypothetical protein H6765_02315 [Candidatus Peribacteria bacterium]